MRVSWNSLGFLHLCARFGSSLRGYGRRHLFEMITGGILLVLTVWLLSSGLKVLSGYSKTVETPGHLIRLQIINGSGDKTAIATVTSRLDNYANTVFEIEIVAGENFEIRRAGRTVIVSRQEDLTMTNQLARILGIDPGTVFYRPLENNRSHISTTLILGKDFRDEVLTALSDKENTGKS
jgi:hypothetical protein